MKPAAQVHVRVLRSTVASGVTLAEGSEAEISTADFKVLYPMGKVEPIPAPAEAAAPMPDEPAPTKGEPTPADELGDDAAGQSGAAEEAPAPAKGKGKK